MASTDNLSQDAQTEAPQGDAPQGEPSQSPAPARKRAPRRATKKASAPAPAQPAGDLPAAEPPTGAAPAPANKAGAEPTGAESTAEQGAQAEQQAEQPAEATPPAEKKATRKRAAKKTTRKPAKKAAAKGQLEESEQPADRSESAAAAVAELPQPALSDELLLEPAGAEVPPLGEEEDEEAELAAAAAAPAVLSLGVLFQPPQTPAVPTRRRSRRAQPQVEEMPAAEVPEAFEAVEPAEPAEPEESGQAQQAADEESEGGRGRRRRSRGGKGRRGRGNGEGEEAPEQEPGRQDKGQAAEAATEAAEETEGGAEGQDEGPEGEGATSRRRRRRRRSGNGGAEAETEPGVVTKVREPRKDRDEPTSLKGSTRLEAKKQRRREGREAGRRRTIITEAEFLARRESVERTMVVRERDGKTQIGVLEDGVLVEHYVSRETNVSMAGNVYLGRVQNVLPSMEAAFVDIGKGRNAVLYAGEVNWDAAGLEANQPKRIENALKSGDTVLVQVTKDPIGHKGARLTSQISLPGRYLVYVPEGNMTGISRKLPDTERARLKQILKEVVPESAGVIVRTAAEGASEEELRADVERLTKTWERIKSKADGKSGSKAKSGGAPSLVHGEPDLTVRVIRDVFNEDFTSLVVAGDQAWSEVSDYINDVAPDLAERLKKWTSEEDLFTHHRVDEQIAKAMDRKVWLPSGGSLVIDRTEAMTVIDVNTGKFVGSGGNLEETVTKNNIEAAEEIVRQLRLRDIGGIIVIDFIDMVLESNRDLVVRRLLECLGRDRTKHQVAEVTSLGLVQMTRKRVGSGLIEVFSETCDHCNGRGIIVHAEPVERSGNGGNGGGGHAGHGGQGGQGGQSGQSGGESGGNAGGRSRSRRGKGGGQAEEQPQQQAQQPATPSGPTPAQIAAAAHAAAMKSAGLPVDESALPAQDQPDLQVRESESEEQEQAPRADVTDHPAEVPVAQAAAAAEASAYTETAAETAAETVDETRAETPAQTRSERPGEATPAEEPAAQAPAAEPAPATAPKRRRRGRVVAPAGPPRATAPVVAGEGSETPDATPV
ncbi:Rne/Rng family ribonuclease [Phycicoccus sp. SLBN-51]|uniref:Rne/Rng family ribonuclease n=1 Tax=Phycicoccus sp. SLBN-51 TaxID=2768447 RepID=UPI0011528FC6|nr:Rne/Rng family ribonuclease [Phycicoccus sp. SLBN-51]TQJ50125.1 ribonuclease E [Phycicoccus sp. SLBN-51]